MNCEKIIRKQKLDLELYCLWRIISIIRDGNYCKEILKRLDELYFLIDENLFEEIPHNYDIIEEKCTLTTYFEKFDNNFR